MNFAIGVISIQPYSTDPNDYVKEIQGNDQQFYCYLCRNFKNNEYQI